MIEIKFRAWDGKEITEPYTDDDYRSLNNAIAGARGILMQYTGLKDKNGKEIYEGDIIDAHQTVNGYNLFVINIDERFLSVGAKYVDGKKYHYSVR
ncbi:hypothetical protein DR046_22880 [Jannaschia formosa]|nr:hypothetical protein DR046_22880 [Jannaschia formosa]